MKTSTRIKPEPKKLGASYRAALGRYLARDSEADLQAALKLGRRAVAAGLETLDLALIHERALLDHALPVLSAKARSHMVRQACLFFASAILPLEETHRTAMESNANLSRLNQALKKSTVKLSASNGKLRQEIFKRKNVEQALRQSERQSVQLLKQSQRMQEQMRQLSRRILSAQEEERKRISRELHDVVAQLLTGIHVQLATLKTETVDSTSDLSRKISRTQRLVEKSVNSVHRFARELRPAVLDDLGLIPALHSFLTQFMKATGIRVSLTAFEGIVAWNGARRTALYRVAQEALTNVARHAHASQVQVRIQKLPNAARLQIKDNGKGFDVERIWHARKSSRLGLLGMRERVEMLGGVFTVESAPTQGTTVTADIPLHNGGKERAPA